MRIRQVTHAVDRQSMEMMRPMSGDSSLHDECDAADCVVSTDRRRFLRESAFRAAAALMAVGVSRRTAFAMPLELAAPIGRSGTTVAYSIPAADGAKIDKTNDVILVRWKGALYAFDLACPHQNTALKWNEGDHEFQCPKHHSRFQPDGTYVADSGRATRNMSRFAIAKDGAGVHVDLDKLYEAEADEAEWNTAFIKIA